MALHKYTKLMQTSKEAGPLETQTLDESSRDSSDDTVVGDSDLDFGHDEKYRSTRLRRGYHRASSLLRPLTTPVLISSFFLLVIVALVCFQFFHARKVWLNCGSSPAEARSRGCKYDMLSHAWQTSECYDEEISEGWRLSRNSTYYADSSYNATVPEEVVMQGELEVYVDQDYHTEHCPWMWRQMHRAYAVKGYIDDHLDKYEHTLHCQNVLMRTTLAEALKVRATILYPNCNSVWHSPTRFRNVGVYGSS